MVIDSKCYCDYCRKELKVGDAVVCIADSNQNIARGVSPKFKFFCERCYLLIDNM
jgi:hypothetical protein